MKVYLVDITTRKNDRDDTLGPYSTFEKAKDALREVFQYWKPGKLESYKEYGSNFEEGRIFTEETSAEIYEREIQ